MVETTAAASPGDDRRKKQVLLQKKKAKRNADEASKRPETPEQQPKDTANSLSPITRRASAFVSRRRKQSIENRRNKITSPAAEESPVQHDGGAELLNDDKKKEHPQVSMKQVEDSRVTKKPAPKPEDAPSDQKHSTEQCEVTDISNLIEESTAVSPKEDRNDKVEVEKKSCSWDTRSIHEFPPEPAVEPSWDTSKTALFDDKQKQAEEEMDSLDAAQEASDFSNKDQGIIETCFEENNDEFNTFEAGSWAAATAPTIKNVDCTLDVGVGTVDNGLTTVAIQSMSVAAGQNDEKPSVDDNDDHDATPQDQPAKNPNDNEQDCARVNVNETDTDGMIENEVDFSATDLNNPLNVLKDDEALLGSDHVRSDVADGNETDALNAIRLLYQAEQQKRIEQYKAHSDDSSTDEDDDEVPEDNSDDESGEEDEIRYISADSEEEEELARHVSALCVPEMIVDTEDHQGATFGAAMAAADSAVVNDHSQVQLENLGLVTTNSSSSGSFKADSTAVESSIASSALAGAGLVSLAGTSVSGSSVGAAVAAAVAPPPPPPPPPPSEPPKKKKASKGSKKKQAPLLKIPPPPPEKLKKWEEDKMRPFKHLEAVADSKDKAPVKTYEQPDQIEEALSSEYVSLSLRTSVSSAHSQDEIETTLNSGSDSRTNVIVDGNEKELIDQQICESDQVEHFAGLNLPQVTQQTQDMSLSDTRSVHRDDATSFATSIASPPRVDRTKLDQAVGLAPGKDGIWKEENFKNTPATKTSPTGISDRNMAERLAVASSTAAMKFEERYGEKDNETRISRSASADSRKNIKRSTAKGPKKEDKADMSYFCSPEILGGTSFCQPLEDTFESEDGNLLSHISSQAKTWVSADGSGNSAADAKQRSLLDNSFDDTHHAGLELVGGAFSIWKNSDFVHAKSTESSKDTSDKADKATAKDMWREELELLAWLEDDILRISTKVDEEEEPDNRLVRKKLLSILQADSNFNSLCSYASVNVIMSDPSGDSSDPYDDGMPTQRSEVVQSRASVHPFLIPADISKRPSATVLAANFISFLNRISLLSGIESPFKDENPFLLDVVNMSFQSDSSKSGEGEESRTVQNLIFEHELGEVAGLVRFFYQACGRPTSTRTGDKSTTATLDAKLVAPIKDDVATSPPIEEVMNLLYKIPTQSPCPFETAAWNLPSVIAIVLEFLGDPVAVCRMKMVNHFCHRLIQENEHVIMRDAVRLGGIGMHIRPAFWMWITLEKCGRNTDAAGASRGGDVPAQSTGLNSQARQEAAPEDEPKCITVVLPELEKRGREGKWHHVIQRDVARAFGNMPPHKTGARLRTDSIVRALVTWGRGRVLSRGVKGGGVSSPTPIIPPPGSEKPKSKPRPATGPPPWETGGDPDREAANQGPPETVSQWSGISPVPSFCSGVSGESGSASARANLANGIAKAFERDPSNPTKNSRAIEELALSGNTLTTEMKEGLQNQLGYILHALAAAHEDVGYCQGMDYVVAHLLRVLQDTVRWHSVRGTLSPVIKAQPKIPVADTDEQSLTKEIDQAIESSLVVEETVFRVMDTFLTSYNLRHLYFPELRCLKTCCRVFERIIQIKLPVLADHFAYHELNVGLFALGWFQTLFLYLPSMPSATVCHMWDIWLVERSFKIFFRVGTAILFLSQPILLNHELEGMMTYLNTFPDATLLNPDILIACALQIKVTNRMLSEIERDLTGGY